MADRVETFAVGCSGGLVTNLPSLTQAAQFSGTAIELENFEPTVEGGYRRINGYTKYNELPIPVLPTLYTTASYSAGVSTINVTNLPPAPETLIGKTFIIGFPNPLLVPQVYTVTTSGSYSITNRTVNITFTPALSAPLSAVSPITVLEPAANRKMLVALSSHNDGAIVISGYNEIYSSQNFYIGVNQPIRRYGWRSIPISNGTTQVNGAGQTGTSLVVKDLRYAPKQGDLFYIGSNFYVVNTSTAVVNGVATLTLYSSLVSSPANSAAVTWVSSWGRFSYIDSIRLSTTRYSKNGYVYTAVAGYYPFLLENEDLIYIIDGIQEVKYTAHFKNTLFFSKPHELLFSAPYDELNFNVADGAGTIAFADEITGLKALRDSLLIFCKTSIYRLVGSSSSDFRTELVSSAVGCISHDSIQEINGDVVFLTDSGLCLLSDTEKTSGLGINLVSDKIRKEMDVLLTPPVDPFVRQIYYRGIYLKNKSQYRLFRYDEFGATAADSIGIAASQVGNETSELSFSKLKGFKVWSCDNLDAATDNSNLPVEYQSVFMNGVDGYVYRMDNGNTFDGTNITATYSTPYYFFNDPKVRKAVLKLTLYTEPEGAVTTTVDTVLDYNKSDVIQPPAVVVGTTGSTYSDTTAPVFTTPLVGNGNSVSLKFTSNTNIPPYIIQSFTIEYSTNDRR